MMRAVLFVLPPPETFPPRLTMTVTYTDRLTGASADRRGENPQPVGGKPRASVFLFYFILCEERKKASQIEKNGSVSWFFYLKQLHDEATGG